MVDFTLCGVLGVMGLSLSGTCGEPADSQMKLPEEDRAVWEHKIPDKPKPKPKPAPVMPPIVIEKVITQKVEVPVPVVEEPVVEEEPKPNPYRIWLENQRSLNASVAASSKTWEDIDISAAARGGNKADNLTAPSLPSLSPTKENTPEYEFERRESTLPVDNKRKLTIDRYITGVLETGINSQLSSKEGGDVIIQVSRDIFAYGTRNLLIPKASRMNCSYETPGSLNATRIALKCYRILLAGDKKGRRVEISQLDAPVGDQQGRAGITGHVNNHFAKQYGTAIMLSLISASVRGSSAMLSSGDGESNTTADIADAASQELGTRFGEISASILEKNTNIVPTITVAQGKRVQIRLRKDWYLKEIKS
ncbi:MAG: TrbI/VirB10 family protein [Methylocystaceae bacterium]|nr:TrbI/VirB10 family protein [Methylocystaceae bacterium]